MYNILAAVMFSYVMTLLITSASLFYKIRLKIKTKFPKLQFGHYPHFIECRLCVGFWVSIIASFIFNVNLFVVYGVSYFLATQEN